MIHRRVAEIAEKTRRPVWALRNARQAASRFCM